MATSKYSPLYQRIWRWHFFAGLLVAPIAILLAITGGIYLFAPQINGWSEHEVNQTWSTDSSVVVRDSDQVLGGLLAQHPDHRFKRLTLPKPQDRSYEIELVTKAPGADLPVLRYWIDKETGAIITSDNPEKQFTSIVKNLHGELLNGRAGSLIVELAACWLIILIITGCYLYWPRGQSLRQVMLPSLKVSGRKFWLALHGSIAAWASLFILVLLISGLPWTQVWGAGFKWAQENIGIPDQGQEWRVTLKSDPSPETVASPITLQAMMTTAIAEKLKAPVYVIPPKADGVWTVRSLHPNRANRVTIHYDQWSGAEKMRIEFAGKHWFKRFVSHGISLHEGQLFGPLNQLLGVLTALSVIAIAVTGPIMWWRRRPSGKLAAPRLPDYKIEKPLALLIVFLGVILPVAGLSMLVIAGFDLARKTMVRARYKTA